METLEIEAVGLFLLFSELSSLKVVGIENWEAIPFGKEEYLSW